jgi:hypothetical protein
MPGKYVFPGGRVDKSDNRVPVAAPITSELEANLLKGSPKIIPSRARALRSPRSARPARKPVSASAAKVEKPVKLDGAWKPFSDAGLLPDPVRPVPDRARDHPARPRPPLRHPFFTADASAIAHRVEGVIHAEAELVKLVWVEIGSEPLADAHGMTKSVLAELDRRLATGPLRTTRRCRSFISTAAGCIRMCWGKPGARDDPSTSLRAQRSNPEPRKKTGLLRRKSSSQ